MTSQTKPTRVFGIAGEPATEALLAKFTQKGQAVVLADIKASAANLSEFLGRGFSVHPMAVRSDGGGWGGDVEMINAALDKLPDPPPAPAPAPAAAPAAAPAPAATPQAAPAAPTAEPAAEPVADPAAAPAEPAATTTATATAPEAAPASATPQPEAAPAAAAPEPASAASGKVN